MMHKRARRARRRGAAVVEMAVVSPVLITLLFGIIEYGWVFSIKQTLTNAAREGCRVATMPGSTDSEIDRQIQNYLNAAGLASSGYSITKEHGIPADPQRGITADANTERVTVSVPYRNVSLLGGFFGTTQSSWSLGSSCSMKKEGT